MKKRIASLFLALFLLSASTVWAADPPIIVSGGNVAADVDPPIIIQGGSVAADVDPPIIIHGGGIAGDPPIIIQGSGLTLQILTTILSFIG